MVKHKNYLFCFSSSCGFCIKCVIGGNCPYKNPLNICTESTGEVFIPKIEKTPWEKYQEIIGIVNEYRRFVNSKGINIEKEIDNVDESKINSERVISFNPKMDTDYNGGELINDSIEGDLKPISVIKWMNQEKVEKLKNKYGKKFIERGKYYQPDFPVNIQEMMESRSLGIEIKGKIQCSDKGIFNADIQDEIEGFKDDDYEKYFKMFEGYKERLTDFLRKNNYISYEDIGNIPVEVDTEDGKYALIREWGGNMCDEPVCCTIGHCIVNSYLYKGVNYPKGNRYEYTQFYANIPIYRNKMHELCILCIMEGKK